METEAQATPATADNSSTNTAATTAASQQQLPPVIDIKEVEVVVDQMRERLDEHDVNRASVQDRLDEICTKLHDQITTMRDSVNNALKEKFDEEDGRMQETLSGILRLVEIKERSPKEDEDLAALMMRAKAILLVKRSYELRRPPKPKKKDDNNNGMGGRGPFGGQFGGFGGFGNGVMPLGGFNNGIMQIGGGLFRGGPFGQQIPQGGEEKKDNDEEKDPDLSKLYELATKDVLVTEKLTVKKPTDLAVTKVDARGVHLSFSGSFNKEEVKVLADHGLEESIAYKVSICKNGCDEWTEYTTKPDGDGYVFSSLLEAEAVYSVKVRGELQKNTSEWSDPVTFSASFKEGCGWMEWETNEIGQKEYVVSEDNPMVVTSPLGGNRMKPMTASMTLPPNKVTSWSIKLVSVVGNGHGVFIGVTEAKEGKDPVNQYGPQDIGWLLDCCSSSLTKSTNGAENEEDKNGVTWERRSLGTGDVIGVVMDTTKGELSFVVNGVSLGVAFDEIPLDKPLVPCVVLYGFDGNSVELDTSEVKEDVNSSTPVPSNIVIKSITWDSITFSWDTVKGASFYQIEVDGSKFWNLTKASTFTKEELLPDTEHTFRVRAVCGKKVSEWSNVLKGKADVLPDFSECTWKEDAGSFGRKFYTVDSKNPKVVANTSGERCSVTGNVMIPLNKVTSWSIKVRANKTTIGGNRGTLVGVAQFKAEQVNNMRYIGEAFGWCIDASSYKLYSGLPHDFSGMPYGNKELNENDEDNENKECVIGVVMDTTKGELSFVVDGINLGVAYDGIPLDKPLVPCVTLARLGDSVELDMSEVREVAVSSSVPVPSNVVAKGITWDSIAFSWDAVEGASFYQIEVDGNDSLEKCKTNEHILNDLHPGTEHSFRVRVVCRDRMSEWCDIVKGKTLNKMPEFTECVWRVGSEGKGYRLEKENRRIAIKLPRMSLSVIRGNIPIPPNKVTSWSVKMSKRQDTGGLVGFGSTWDCVGIAPCDIDHEAIFVFDGTRGIEFGWYFDCNNSTLCSGPPHNYNNKEYGPKKRDGHSILEGSSVGVVMDTTNGELSFVVDGVNLGVAFEGVPLDKPLVPCVILCRNGDSVKLDTSEVKENVNGSTPVPSNTATKSITWDSITLSWSDVEEASFYQIEVDGSKFLDVSTTNTFTKTGLLQETEHSFRVRAVCGSEVSEWSDVVKEKTQKAQDFSECIWKECPGESEYDKQYRLSDENKKVATRTAYKLDSTIIGSTPLPLNKVTSWNIKILKSKSNDGDEIYIGVAPFDINQGDNTNFYRCGWYFDCGSSTLRSGPPHSYKSKEYGPKKENGSYVHTGDSVGVVMDTAKGELSFVVGGVNLGVAFEGIPLDKPLVPCVIIRCQGDSIELELSEVKEDVNGSTPVPSSVTTKCTTWDRITLSWDAVEEASFYQIEVDGSKFWDASTTNTFTKRGLQPDIEHTFSVRTVCGNEVSEWSDIVKGRTQAIPDFSGSVWKECPDEVRPDKKYSIDNKNKKVATKGVAACSGIGDAPFAFNTIVGSTPLPFNKVTSWSIKVLKSKANNGKGINVGVAPFDINQDERDHKNRCGWYFSCFSSTLYSGPPHSYSYKEYGLKKKKGEYVHTGDSVGVVMDTIKGELSFVVNGVNFGIAYEGIPLDKPLVPCVLLTMFGDSVELILK